MPERKEKSVWDSTQIQCSFYELDKERHRHEKQGKLSEIQQSHPERRWGLTEGKRILEA